jgi:hypothetical protein
MSLAGPGRMITGTAEDLVTDWADADVITGQPTGWAVFNQARTHRYLLARYWDTTPAVQTLTFVMLNPSDADAFRNDPTVGRCMRFAHREGYGGIRVLNAYGYRSPRPADLRAAADPVGPSNDAALDQWARGTVVVAWGAHPFAAGRVAEVAAHLTAGGARLLCLGTTMDGSPIHPLARGRSRVPDDAPLVPWAPPDVGAAPTRAASAPLPPPAGTSGEGPPAGGGDFRTAWGRALARQHADTRRRVTQPRRRPARGIPGDAGPGMIRRPPPGSAA